jgi:chromosome segregation ATPase
MRIPAVQRYLTEKRSLAAELQTAIVERDRRDDSLREAEAQRNLLAAEISQLRAVGEKLVEERNATQEELERIGATARYLAAARDAALDKAEQVSNARDSLLRDQEMLRSRIERLQYVADAAAADRDALHKQIEEIRELEARLTVDIEISRASLTRAIIENERLRIRVAENLSTPDQGDGSSC